MPSPAADPSATRDLDAIAVEPPGWRTDALADAVRRAGAKVVSPVEATALVWTEPRQAPAIREVLHDGIDWVQLPFAGIEPFLPLLDRDRRWTCGKGVYADPVAEHALACTLALLRHLPGFARAHAWSPPAGRNLFDARVTILGGGGIAESLVPLLTPFRCQVTIVRRSSEPFPGAHDTVGLADLDDALPRTDVLVLALAVTPETVGVMDGRRLGLLPPHAVVVNVARGVHVVTDDLARALADATIAGAALDVTDPEPLPDGHPLWTEPRCLVTPHTANTPEMGIALLAQRVEDNVRRRLAGQPLIGPVDVDLGY